MIPARQKAVELVKALHKVMDARDIYWNATDDAKEAAIVSIDTICEKSEYWEEVKKEINLLPYYIEDLQD